MKTVLPSLPSGIRKEDRTCYPFSGFSPCIFSNAHIKADPVRSRSRSLLRLSRSMPSGSTAMTPVKSSRSCSAACRWLLISCSRRATPEPDTQPSICRIVFSRDCETTEIFSIGASSRHTERGLVCSSRNMQCIQSGSSGILASWRSSSKCDTVGTRRNCGAKKNNRPERTLQVAVYVEVI